MGAHCKSIVCQALDRLGEHMAIRESRSEAKQAQRATGEHTWTFSKGKIYSYKTRTNTPDMAHQALPVPQSTSDSGFVLAPSESLQQDGRGPCPFTTGKLL